MVISRKVINPYTSMIPGTKVQYNKRHLMTSAFLTLTKGLGYTTRSKITDVEVSAFYECFNSIFLSCPNVSRLLFSAKIQRGIIYLYSPVWNSVYYKIEKKLYPCEIYRPMLCESVFHLNRRLDF